jgi:hypothetical protein
MNIKLGRILFPFVVISIISILAIFGLFVDYTNSKLEIYKQNKFDTNAAKMNIALINNGLKLAGTTINIIVPKIHKKIVNYLKNNTNIIQKYNDGVYNYDNYPYNFILYVYNDKEEFEMEYSSIDNNSVNIEIKEKFENIVSENNDNELKFGNIVNRIVVIDSENYVFSVKYIFDSNGMLLGGMALLLRAKLFINFSDFVNNLDTSSYIEVLDNLGNIVYGNIIYGRFENGYDNRIAVYNKDYGITISYISKPVKVDKSNISTVYVIAFYIVMLLFGFMLVYYKWAVNKINKSIKYIEKNENNLNDLIKVKEGLAINNNEGYLFNICNNFINKIDKYKISNNILKIKDNVLKLKKITQNIDNNLFNLREMIAVYKNLEMNGNILEINIAILCNQLNDNRLNDVLVMVRELNHKLHNSNSNAEINLLFNSEYDKLFTLFEKVNNLLELLDSMEKNRINIINSFKEKLERKNNEIK